MPSNYDNRLGFWPHTFGHFRVLDLECRVLFWVLGLDSALGRSGLEFGEKVRVFAVGYFGFWVRVLVCNLGFGITG